MSGQGKTCPLFLKDLQMANAIHTNFFSSVADKSFLRIEFAELLQPGLPPVGHSAVVMTRESARELIRVINETLYKAENHEKSLKETIID